MANFSPIFSDTLQYEGGFQQMSNDTGNYSCGVLAGTNYGISAIALEDYLGRCVSESDMRNLSLSTAEAIYRLKYWDKIQGAKISNQSIAAIIFDAYIMNPSAALRIAKETVNELKGTAISVASFDNTLINAINSCNSQKFFNIYKSKRETFFKSIGGSFVQGWLNRLDNFEYKKEFAIGFVVLITLAIIVYINRKKIFN